MTECSFYTPEDPMKGEPATAATILHEKEEEKHRSARKTIQEILPNKSTKTMGLFQDDIFHNQKVHVGDCRRWSRHLVADTRRPAKISAVPTEEVKPSENNIRSTGHSNVEIHLPEVEETERGQQEVEKREEEIRNDAQEDVCTPQPQDEETEQVEEHLQEPQYPCKTWQDIIQTEELDEFEDIADLEEPMKDKSVRRRFLNWLNELVRYFTTRELTSYRRELEEGNQIDRTYMKSPMTRAETQQRKKKEALRVKDEELYEKWAAQHGRPKKRMSKWEKRFLRMEEFLS